MEQVIKHSSLLYEIQSLSSYDGEWGIESYSLVIIFKEYYQALKWFIYIYEEDFKKEELLLQSIKNTYLKDQYPLSYYVLTIHDMYQHEMKQLIDCFKLGNEFAEEIETIRRKSEPDDFVF